MNSEVFRRDLSALTTQLQQRPLDSSLSDWLNSTHAPGTATFDALREACASGVREGWLCQREGGGIKYPAFSSLPKTCTASRLTSST